MKLTTRLSRRFAAGVGLASAAILLPTAALASSSAAGAPSHPSVPACISTHTRVWYGEPSEGATGHLFFQLEISNVGHSTCSFFGYPGVSALDIHGHQVGLPATHSGARLHVTLAPGGTTHVVLEITQAGFICAHPVNAVALKVFAPGQVHAQFVGLATEGCPGRSVLHVDSVHPGTGIPGYTIR